MECQELVDIDKHGRKQKCAKKYENLRSKSNEKIIHVEKETAKIGQNNRRVPLGTLPNTGNIIQTRNKVFIPKKSLFFSFYIDSTKCT